MIYGINHTCSLGPRAWGPKVSAPPAVSMAAASAADWAADARGETLRQCIYIYIYIYIYVVYVYIYIPAGRAGKGGVLNFVREISTRRLRARCLRSRSARDNRRASIELEADGPPSPAPLSPPPPPPEISL